MSRKKKQAENRDIFNDLMFGKQPEPEPEKKPTFLSTIEQMTHFIDTIGPTVDKLAPLIVIAQAFFNNDTKGKKSDKKEENSP
ncbi:hypothetical protein BTS2_0880 [Bacillus sp. TS-2]|nr:hypothetical protein BTS2_0880 [Bacillus sp. TS-2]